MKKEEIEEQLENLKGIVEPLCLRNFLDEVSLAGSDFPPVNVLLDGETRCGRIIASTKAFSLVEIDGQRAWYPSQQVCF